MDAVICGYMGLYANFGSVLCLWVCDKKRQRKYKMCSSVLSPWPAELLWGQCKCGLSDNICLPVSFSILTHWIIHYTEVLSHVHLLHIVYKHMHTLNLQYEIILLICSFSGVPMLNLNVTSLYLTHRDHVILFWKQDVNSKWGKPIFVHLVKPTPDDDQVDEVITPMTLLPTMAKDHVYVPSTSAFNVQRRSSNPQILCTRQSQLRAKSMPQKNGLDQQVWLGRIARIWRRGKCRENKYFMEHFLTTQSERSRDTDQ